VLYEEEGGRLAAALPLYVKGHSYGEYVFDWAWADAYQRNGLDYYPKLLSAIPFTPVTGPRLLARDAAARAALIEVLRAVQQSSEVSSTHLLFPPEDEARQLAGRRLPAAQRRAVPLGERGLRQLRRLPRHAGTEEAQEHPRRAAQGARSRRHAAARARARCD
jgi:hypothetical protein